MRNRSSIRAWTRCSSSWAVPCSRRRAPSSSWASARSTHITSRRRRTWPTPGARLKRRPGVCMAASGPGATNLVTGVANAFADAAPLVAIGGSSPKINQRMDAFQEIDQVAVFKPITKWSERILDARRIPDLVASAFRHAMTGKPGPGVSRPARRCARPAGRREQAELPGAQQAARRGRLGDLGAVKEAIALLARAERPLIIGGSGVWWSDAAAAFQAFVEATGIPFYTTPDLARHGARGSRAVLPERPRQGLRRGGRDPRGRHALQLRDPVRPAAALRRRTSRSSTSTSNPTELEPQPHRRRADRRRRARRARAAARGGRRARSIPKRYTAWTGPSPRARRREAGGHGQGHVHRADARSTRCGSARRCATSSGATRSWSSTARRS